MKKWKKDLLSVLAAFVVLAVAAGEICAYAQEQNIKPDSSEAQNANGEGEDEEIQSGGTERTGIVCIDYKDKTDGTGPIAGAEFTFFRSSEGKETAAGSLITDHNGTGRITLKEGNYEVRETKPAAGHEASATFRLTIPMKEEGKEIYMITAEPKPVRTPRTSPAPSPSLTPAPDSAPRGTPAPSKTSKQVSKKNVSVPAGTKATAVRTRPAKTSDMGRTVTYAILVGSAAAVIGTMLWIREKGGRR